MFVEQKNPLVGFMVFTLLLLACFQGAAALVLGKGLPYYYIVIPLFFLCYFLLNGVSKKSLLFLFFSLSFPLLSFIFASLSYGLFPDLVVLEPSKGIDSQIVEGGTRISFGVSQVGQSTYLFLNLLLLFIMYDAGVTGKKINHRTLLVAIFSIVLILGWVEYLLKVYETNLFPYSLTHSNEYYAINTHAKAYGEYRFVGTFIEASYVSVYLTAMFFYCLMINGFKYLKAPLLFLSFIGILLTYSATGYLSFALGVIIYLFFYGKKVSRYIVISSLFISIPFLLGSVLRAIEMKLNSDSGVNRFLADMESLKILFDTWFMGAGLGAHRSSSFIFNTVANIGFLAIPMFASIAYVCYRLYKAQERALFLMLVVYVFGMCLSLPEINNPVFFSFLAISVYVLLSQRKVTHAIH